MSPPTTPAMTRLPQNFKAETGIPGLQMVGGRLRRLRGTASNKVEADLGPVDILVNNAGITRDAMFHKMTPRAVERGDRYQPFRPLQHDASALERHARAQVRPRHQHLLDQRPEGPDRAGRTTPHPRPATSASPRRWPRKAPSAGITVNAICPGYIATEMVKAVPEKVLEERIVAQIPVGRLGEPDEIARCVVFLASDECRLHHRLDALRQWRAVLV